MNWKVCLTGLATGTLLFSFICLALFSTSFFGSIIAVLVLGLFALLGAWASSQELSKNG